MYTLQIQERLQFLKYFIFLQTNGNFCLQWMEDHFLTEQCTIHYFCTFLLLLSLYLFAKKGFGKYSILPRLKF